MSGKRRWSYGTGIFLTYSDQDPPLSPRNVKLSHEEQSTAHKDAEVTQKIDNGIEAQKRVFEISAYQWKALTQELTRHRVLTPKETGILQIAVQIPAKIPTEKQCLILMGVLEKARNEGLIAVTAAEEDA
jgi:hypothetical protein